jgi:tetratricopeptide (TPR) repeat protein
VLVFQGRDAEAIPFYKRAGDLAPDNYLAWINLADAYRRTNAPGEAQQEYLRAHQLARQEIERNPQNAYVRACIAYLLARLGEPEEAEHEIRQSLALPWANAEEVLQTDARCQGGVINEFKGATQHRGGIRKPSRAPQDSFV